MKSSIPHNFPVLLILCLLLLPGMSFAQGEFKIIPDDGEPQDLFGNSVSNCGDYAVVGARGDDPYGSAYVYHRNGESWIQQAKLTSNDGEYGDEFAFSVSISGDYIVVGAQYNVHNFQRCGSAYVFHRDGENWTQQAKLTAADGQANDFFGCSVSIDNDYIIVGATGDDDNGDRSGSAYIFHRDGENWTQQAKLTASDGASLDFFGRAVSINCNYAIVGAPFDDDDGSESGSGYIFHRVGESWGQTCKLTSPDGSAQDRFGSSVSISGDCAVVGACRNDDRAPNAGSAFVFERSGENWSFQTQLMAVDGSDNDFFGISVCIDGEWIVSGTANDDDKGSSSGSAYIFNRDNDNWVQKAKVTASDGAHDDTFGQSVSVSGRFVFVGAIYDDDNGTSSGSAYIYDITEIWAFNIDKILPNDGEASDRFGKSVSICGDYAVIGAYGENSSTGCAYIFHRDGESWMQQAKLDADDQADNDLFGWSVSLHGDYAVIGACYDDDNGNESGSAYIFHRDGENWSQQAKLIADDGENSDNFGISVAIHGDYAVVGASKNDQEAENSGAVYVFHRDGQSWTQQVKLTADDAESEDAFGYSVSIDGDYIVIGASLDDDNGNNAGSAYIFYLDNDSWTQQAKLTAGDGAARDGFGNVVDISGEYVLTSAFLDDDMGGNSGSAYIFHRSDQSWMQQIKLTAGDGESDDWFGYSVSIDGDRAVVGALNSDGCGSAYVYYQIEGSWLHQHKVLAGDLEEDDDFGISVSNSGEYGIVGASGKDDNGSNSGSAYIFKFYYIDYDFSEPDIDTDPLELDFGEVEIPSSSVLSFQIANNGDADLTVSNITVDEDCFSTNFGGEFVLAPEASQLIAVEFEPPAVGEFSGRVTVHSDDPDSPECHVDLYGVGIPGESPEALTEELIDEIEEMIDEGEMNGNQAGFLLDGLEMALECLENGQIRYAISYLNEFMQRVACLVWWGILSYEEGEAMIAAAQEILDAIEAGEGASLDELLAQIQELLPDYFALHQPYPNPFNSKTTIEYAIPFDMPVELSIYNILGQRVILLVDEVENAGKHEIVWDASRLPSGMYVIRLDAFGQTMTRKVMLIR